MNFDIKVIKNCRADETDKSVQNILQSLLQSLVSVCVCIFLVVQRSQVETNFLSMQYVRDNRGILLDVRKNYSGS